VLPSAIAISKFPAAKGIPKEGLSSATL